MSTETLSPAEVEANKDQMDLAPVLRFVEANREIYASRLEELLAHTTEKGRAWAQEREIIDPPEEPWQVPVELAQEVLAALPPLVRQLSALRGLSYQFTRGVPVPNFNAQGFVDATKPLAAFVPLEDFPGEHHPTRIFIGNAHEGVINLTPVPPTVSTDPAAITAYQVHVLLHELWHTVEGPMRNTEQAERVTLELQSGERLSFAEWRRLYLAALHSNGQAQFVTAYAATYADRIKPDMDCSDIAFAEQTAEGFVGYTLGILPNQQGATSFRSTHPGLWSTMNDLVHARVLKP
jgi:hypothetical protein